MHGSFFEFARNAAFDARNYFDHKSVADERRIPPFVRNEFGFTNGGPVVLPGIYDGRGRTFYFGQYQGFRQVLGTTQVFPVPTAAERQGIDTETFPGDTLTVPVNPAIVPVLDRYPLPNDPNGAYGERTYAASSKIYTRTDQFSVRIDHRISDKASLLTRFSLNQVTGPLTNPDQTAIDPSFAVQFFDHQRNAGVKYSRTISPHLYFRHLVQLHSQHAVFSHHQSHPACAGFRRRPFSGIQLGGWLDFRIVRQPLPVQTGHELRAFPHAFKWGVEIRANRDATIFGSNPNGVYTFGGGTAYSPVLITSASGTHNIQPGDPLPDSLTGLLTATPYSLQRNRRLRTSLPRATGSMKPRSAARPTTSTFRTHGRPDPHLTFNYGLRYEVNSRIHEAENRTSLPKFIGADGKDVPYWDHSAKQIFLYNPQPPYDQDWNGWGPRLSVDYAADQPHRAARRRRDYNDSAQFVAGQFRYRQRFPSRPASMPARCPTFPCPSRIGRCR